MIWKGWYSYSDLVLVFINWIKVEDIGCTYEEKESGRRSSLNSDKFYLRIFFFNLKPYLCKRHIQPCLRAQQWLQDWKMSVFISIPKEGNAKDCLNYCIIALISHTSEAMLKILQEKLQQYVNWEPPDVQAGFRKGRGIRDQIANICWIIEKPRKFQKNIYFCFIDYAKAFDCVGHNKLWKILRDMEIPDHLTCLMRNLYAGQETTVGTGHGTIDWF